MGHSSAAAIRSPWLTFRGCQSAVPVTRLILLLAEFSATNGSPAVDPSRTWLGGARVAQLWPTPVWSAQLDRGSFAPLNAELLVWIKELYKADRAGKHATNAGGWQSKSGVHLNASSKAVEVLSGHIFAAAGDYVERGLRGKKLDVPNTIVDAQCTIDALWVNVNRARDHNFVHVHTGQCSRLVSGTYYVSVPPGTNGGKLVMLDPRGQTQATMTQPMAHWFGFTEDYEIQPADGQLVLWPGWLFHYVEPHGGGADPGMLTGNAERVSISFNICVHFQLLYE
eukprot:gnl/TRDRNA2_/TRDRNA2_163694_c1_seq2.p1 gnl/TRDRNA2_/TRDRNA2_163694_c1~~gnl/TRDRNA2_/TRDRNA2_163694_c1_seq2.p1  ORF type:complete len:282 (+),score=37.03 gnl/TRDRNA2_/TRDRNA2_163694_c1_seq2:35-880(+)